MLIGTAAGDLLRRKLIAPLAKVGILEICGAGLIAGGFLLSHDLPMNKPLWTASYILYAAGWACMVLGLLYLLIDVLPGRWDAWQRWATLAAFPLVVAGANAITVYVLPIMMKALVLRSIHVPTAQGEILDGEQAIQQTFYDHFGRIPGGWLYTLGYMVLCWLLLLFLYRKRWFLKV
jgi:predicted acyltransferase